MTDKKDEALKLALETLDCIYSPLHVREINKVSAAITAIREALAEQPAQQQEPVAIALNTGTKQGVKWLKNVEHGESLYTTQQPAQDQDQSCPNCESLSKQVTALKTCLEVERGFREQEQPAQQQEPVAWRHDMGEENGGWEYFEEASCPECQPLYTSPPASKPLTDEQIMEMYNEPRSDAEMLEFARAIEAAHGIGEQK